MSRVGLARRSRPAPGSAGRRNAENIPASDPSTHSAWPDRSGRVAAGPARLDARWTASRRARPGTRPGNGAHGRSKRAAAESSRPEHAARRRGGLTLREGAAAAAGLRDRLRGRDRWSEATLVRETAHTLNSGWKESGSTASLVTALTLRYSPNRSFQWNGAKQLPGRTRSRHDARAVRRGRAGRRPPPGRRRRSPSPAASSRVDLDERAGVELVELGDLAGLGQRVPLVLQPAGVEDERVGVVGQLGGRQVRAGEEDGPAARGGEGEPRAAAVGPYEQGLADAVVEVADGVAVGAPSGRARATAPGSRAAVRRSRRAGRSRSAGSRRA